MRKFYLTRAMQKFFGSGMIEHLTAESFMGIMGVLQESLTVEQGKSNFDLIIRRLRGEKFHSELVFV